MSGRSITVSGDHLEVKPVFGTAVTLIPVADTLFRLEADVEADAGVRRRTTPA